MRNYHENSKNIENKVVLRLDIKNAFNTISIKSCIKEVKKHIPHLNKWAEWCYLRPSRLIFGDHVIIFETGIQQGGPIGSLLFAMGFHPILL